MLQLDQYQWLREALKWLTARLSPAGEGIFGAELVVPFRSVFVKQIASEQFAAAIEERRQAADRKGND